MLASASLFCGPILTLMRLLIGLLLATRPFRVKMEIEDGEGCNLWSKGLPTVNHLLLLWEKSPVLWCCCFVLLGLQAGWRKIQSSVFEWVMLPPTSLQLFALICIVLLLKSQVTRSKWHGKQNKTRQKQNKTEPHICCQVMIWEGWCLLPGQQNVFHWTQHVEMDSGQETSLSLEQVVMAGSLRRIGFSSRKWMVLTNQLWTDVGDSPVKCLWALTYPVFRLKLRCSPRPID